jgi:hypothetical protein
MSLFTAGFWQFFSTAWMRSMMHSSTASIESASFRVLIGPLSPIIIFSLLRTGGTGLRTSLRTRRGGGPNWNWIGCYL